MRISDWSSDVCSSDLCCVLDESFNFRCGRVRSALPANRHGRNRPKNVDSQKTLRVRPSNCANLTLLRKSMSKLFSPMQLGPYELSHRVIMALLTRTRSKPGDMPGDLMVEYYTQRASKGGLLISEAPPVSLRGYGYAGARGIYAERHIAGW